MSKFVLTAQLQLQAPTNTQQVINELKAKLAGLNVPVKVTGSAQAAKQLKQVQQQTQQATTAAHKMGKAFGASIKRFAAFNIATRAVGLLASKLASAVDEAIQFQRQLIKISQVTGKTTGELSDLVKEVTRLSTVLGVSSTSLLDTTRILAQAGIQAGDLKIALAALAKTTLAPTFDNITQTAEGAVAILAQFEQGVGSLEQQLGSINAIAGQFAVESGDLISVIRRAGGVFKQAGGSLNELLALFTSVRATTRENAESIATGLRTIFTRIQRPQTIQYLKQFGVELLDLEGKFVGPYKAVEQLSLALSGLEEGDIRFVEIAEQLGGFRQIGKVIPLIQQFSTAERARQAALEGGNSLNKDAAIAQQALAVQIEKTREKFLALIRSISETSTFRIMIQSLLGIAEAFLKVAETIKPIIPLIAAFAAFKLAKGIGGFASGLGAGMRGKNQGGKIHAFARGGSVPGTGNRDTVPAMLTPGEFVIRKSSVSKIGASTLASMNENKYAKGGITTMPSQAIQNLIYKKKKKVRKEPGFDFKTTGGEQNQFTEKDTVNSQLNKEKVGIKQGVLHRMSFTKQKQLLNSKSPSVQGIAFEDYLRTEGRMTSPSPRFSGNEALDGIKGSELVEAKRTGVSDTKLLDKLLRDQLKHGDKLNKQSLKGGPGGDTIGLPPLTEVSLNLASLSGLKAKDPIKKGKNKFFGGPIRHYATAGRVLPLSPTELTRYKSLNAKGKKATPEEKKDRGVLETRFKQGGTKGPKTFNSGRSYGAVYLERATSPKGGKSSITFPRSKGKEEVKVNYDLNHAFLDPVDGQKIKKDIVAPRAEKAVNETASYLAKLIGEKVSPTKDIPNFQAIVGSVFEKGVGIVSKNKAALDIDDGRTFDFAGGLGGASKVFGADGAKLRSVKTDAKVASTSSAVESVRKKVKTDLTQSRSTLGFAKGGGVPSSSDTVPAMLTPGEFVINKKASQSIGYGNLNKMNKQGVVGYANGGAVEVQKFANGAMVQKQAQHVAGISARGDVSSKVYKDAMKKLEDMTGGLGKAKKALDDLTKGATDKKKSDDKAKGAPPKPTPPPTKSGDFKMDAGKAGGKRSGPQVVGREKYANPRLPIAPPPLTEKQINQTLPLDRKFSNGTGFTGNSTRPGSAAAPGLNRQLLPTQQRELARGKASAGLHKEDVDPGASKAVKKLIKQYEKESKDLEKKSKLNKKGIDGLKKLQVERDRLARNLQINSDAAKKGVALGGSRTPTGQPPGAILVPPGGGGRPPGGGGRPPGGGPPTTPPENKKGGGGGGVGIGGIFAAQAAIAMIGPMIVESAKTTNEAGEKVSTGMSDMTQYLVEMSGALIMAGFMLSQFSGAAAFFSGTLKTGAIHTQGMFSSMAAKGQMAVNGLGMFAAVAGGAYIGIELLTSSIRAYHQLQEKLNKAVKKGDVEGAGKLADEQVKEESDISTAKIVTVFGVLVGMTGALIYSVIAAKISIWTLSAATSGLSVKMLLSAGVFALAAGALTYLYLASQKAAVEKDKEGNVILSSAALRSRADALVSKNAMLVAEAAENAAYELNQLKSGDVTAMSLLTGDAGTEVQDAAFNKANVEAADLKVRAADKQEAEAQNSRAANLLGLAGSDEEQGGGNGSWMTTGGDFNPIALGAAWMALGDFEKATEAAAVATQARKKADQEYITNLKGSGLIRQSFDEVIKTGGDFEDWFDKLEKSAEEGSVQSKRLLESVGRRGSHALRKQFDNQEKAQLEITKRMQALSLGLGSVIGNLEGTALSMSNSLASLENGFSGIGAAFSTFQASMTNSANGLDPGEVDADRETFLQQLSAGGATDEQVNEVREKSKGVELLQRNQESIVEDFKERRADPTNKGNKTPTAIMKEIFKEKLINSGTDPKVAEDLVANLSKKALDKAEKELGSDDPDEAIATLLKDSTDKLNNNSKKVADSLISINKALVSSVKKQIAVEDQYIVARKRTIAAELEAAKIREEFGGPEVTFDDKLKNLNKSLDAQLTRGGKVGGNAASPGGVSAGELLNISNVRNTQQQNINQNRLNNAKNTGRSKTGSFREAQGDEVLQRSKQDQQALVDYSRQRIDLIREEIQIQKEKNKLEKSSLDALLSGDIEGFFKQQAAVGAQAALKSGNQGLVSNFGATAVGAGFQDLAGQKGVDAATKRRAADMTLNQFGITDQGAADVLAEQTPEIRGLEAEARQFADVIQMASKALEGFAKSDLDITTEIVNIVQRRAPQGVKNATPTGTNSVNPNTGQRFRQRNTPRNVAAQNNKDRLDAQRNQSGNSMGFNIHPLSKGGPVYANRGMFIPRGTDTVPAMLTPGEFVVNRASVQRGNNLALLKSMNNNQQAPGPAMAQGGQVQYRQFGGIMDAIGKTFDAALPNLQNVFSGFTSAVEKLTGIQIGVKLDPTNINVTFNNTSFLEKLSEDVRRAALEAVRSQIPNIQHRPGGGHKLDDVG